MENNYCVYKHTTPNKKVYIGITGKDPKKRWCGGSGYFYNVEFHKAIKKYGWGNIRHEILFVGLTKEEAEAKEVELIAEYDSSNPKKGFNYTKGGNHRGMTSEAIKRKISAKAINKKGCMCVETGEKFESLSKAAKKIGIHPSAVGNSCATGGRCSARNLHFVYTDSEAREKALKYAGNFEHWW